MNLFITWPEPIEIRHFSHGDKFDALIDWANTFGRTVVCAKDSSCPHEPYTSISENLAIVGVPNLEGWQLLQDVGCTTRQTIEKHLEKADRVIAFDKCHIGIIAARLALRAGIPYIFLQSAERTRRQGQYRVIMSSIKKWISNDICSNAVAALNYHSIQEIFTLPFNEYFINWRQKSPR